MINAIEAVKTDGEITPDMPENTKEGEDMMKNFSAEGVNNK